jgi:hypothetical protein
MDTYPVTGNGFALVFRCGKSKSKTTLGTAGAPKVLSTRAVGKFETFGKFWEIIETKLRN